MATKVFICWSGELSRMLAEEINSWLPKMLQNVKPFFSPNDIDKGVKWDPEISKEIDMSKIGLICLTHDNMDKPWILFEAGALSGKLSEARVCPILFGFEPAEVKPPLSTFEMTRFTKDDFKKLITTINSLSEDMRIELRILEEAFEVWWPKLDEKIKGIMSSHKAEPKKDPRTERDILIEILELVRTSAKPEKPSWLDEQTLREAIAPFNFDINRPPPLSFGEALDRALRSWSLDAEKTHREGIKKIVDTSTFTDKKRKLDEKE